MERFLHNRFFILFIFLLLSLEGISQTSGDYKSNGAVTFTSSTNWLKWNGASWVTATLAPTSVSSTNIITVTSSNTASVSGTVTLSASMVIDGTVNLSNNALLTLGSDSNWSNITVNSGGNFNMPNGSGSATLVLYGNYYNYGSTDFWKSIVVITGDLLSPSTSALQNQGNVIVGGNIIGDFDLTGGTGGSQIYAVNPNATVTITPTSVDNNVNPGTQPTGESSALQDLVNSVIYGSSSCTSFTITDPSSNISTCTGSNTTASITTTASSPTYQWQVNSGAGWADILGQTTATLNLNNVTASMDAYKYRVKVTKICTKNSNYVTLSANISSIAPTSITGTTTICNGSSTTLTLSGGTVGTGATAKWYTVSCGGTLVGTGNSITVSPTINTTYYVRYEGTCNTTTCASTTVMVNSLSIPPTNITGTTTICNGLSTTLMLSGGTVGTGATAKWYTVSCGGTLVGTGNSITVSPTTNTTYYVRYEGTCNSTTCASRTVIVNSPSSIALTSGTQNPTVCAGTAITNTVYTFSGSATNASVSGLPSGLSQVVDTSAKTVTISGTPTATGTYTITTSGHTVPCTAVTISGTVTVNASPNNVSNGFSATTICTGGSPQLTYNAEASSFSTPYSITYKNDDTSIQYTVAIPSSSAYSFAPADNPTSNTGYTLISISNATCTRTSGFMDSGANLSVRPIPIATISGTTSLCVGASSPNITFTNPQTAAVTVTYNINSGANQTIDIAASSSSNVAVSTGTAGTFVYNLVSVVYQNPSICSNIISGSATVTVNPNLPASVTIAASPSGAICAGTSVTFRPTAVNGGSAPTYQWRVNGVNMSTGATYTTTSLVNSDVVSVIMTSNATPCLTGSPVTSTGITMIVNPIPIVPVVGAITQPTCATATGSFTITNYNATYSYTVSPSVGVIVSGSLVTAPPGVYTIFASASGCTSANANFTINAQPVTPSAPVVGTITQPSCTLDTGSVELIGLPSGTWILTRSGTSASTTTGTGSSIVISGLVDGGSFTFTVSNGTCTSVVSTTVNIDAISTITSTWNGSSWVNGVPDSTRRIIFAGNFSSTDNVTGCTCKVSSGANVVINSAHTLTVTNGVDVQTNGLLTFENNASLVQINNGAVNTGNINYKRYTTPVRRYDFTYWSSPVVGQTLYNLSPNTLYDKYYGYNPDTGWVIYYNGNKVMDPGNGYLIRAPQTFSTTTAVVDTSPKFIGVPNNGVVSLSLTGNKSYLLGNPYPSAINADTFLDLNSAVLQGTLYFWTHNSAPVNTVAGDAIYNYTSNDYATYNRTGGVSVGTAVITGGQAPNGKIGAGQGFFAPTTTAGGTVVFNNSMRVLGNNNQFFKLSTSKTTVSTTEKSRIWLNLTNKEGLFKQTLIGYITGATNNYDSGFDGVTYDGNQYADFYSVNQGINLSIQGRALPFVKQDSVILGYKSTIKGEFQINIDHTDGELASQNVFLEDKDLKILHDLKKGTYTFSSEKGVFDNRFVLRYIDKNTVAKVATKIPISVEPVLVSVQENEITVSSSEELIDKIIIYDVLGKIIYRKEDVAVKDYVIQHLNLAHQVLVVNVVLENEKFIATKIVY